MRVLLVVNTLPPTDVSGVGEQVLQLAKGLESAGHCVEVLGRGPGGAWGPKILFPLTVILPVLRACRRFNPDIVQIHESDGALSALALKTVSATLDVEPILVSLLQVSYIEEIRAVRPLYWKGRLLGSPSVDERVFRWLKAPIQVLFGCLSGWLADLIFAPSRQTADEVERDYRLTRVHVLPNATSAPSSDSVRSDSRNEGSTFLFVGRLRIRKGVEFLLHAMASPELAARGARLVVVGDGEHRDRLESVVIDLGLEERVDFVGRKGRGAIAALMKEATALVVPSIYEGMPLVILESMTHSLPIVASRVSGIPEVLQEAKSGWLVEPEDVEDLTTVLVEVLDDPREATRLGDAGYRWVTANATSEALARIWEETIDCRTQRRPPGTETTQGGARG